MNTKKPLIALAAIACFALTSCTSNASSDDALYEQGVDKTKISIPGADKNGVDKTKISIPGN